MESSSKGKPNFMQQLFARSRRQERKRSRHQVDLPDPNDDPIVTVEHEVHNSPNAPRTRTRRGKHLRRMEACLKRHQKAMEQEREYPVVVRAKMGGDASSSTLTLQSSSTPPDPWNQCLPRLLLILALNLQCHLIVETCPSYDQLRAQLMIERQKYLALSQETARMADRLFLFQQQHVESRRDPYFQLLEHDHQAPSPLAEASNRPRPPLESTTSPLEVVRKPNPRRVTASPARIRMATNDMTAPAPASHVRSPLTRTMTAASSTSTSAHRQAVPNPFQTKHHRTNQSPSCATVPSPLSTRRISSSAPLLTARMVDSCPDPPPTSTTEPPASNPNSSLFVATAAKIHEPQKKLQQQDDNAPHNPKTGSGWMSTRHAKAFVAEVDNTTKHRSEVGLPLCLPVPLFQPQGIAHRLTISKQNPTTNHDNEDDFLDSPSNDSRDKSNEQPYLEVVRNKQERDRLNRYECVECGKFIDAICDQDSQGLYDRHALLCHSRHRSRFTPPQTPEDFWELSFIDERDAKRRKLIQPKAREQPLAAAQQSHAEDQDEATTKVKSEG